MLGLARMYLCSAALVGAGKQVVVVVVVGEQCAVRPSRWFVG